MVFDICFLDEPLSPTWFPKNSQGLTAEIIIEDFTEPVLLHTEYWSREQYIEQWISGLDRLIDTTAESSALITSIYDPNKRLYGYVVSWWPLYRQGDVIYVQNTFIAHDYQKKPIDLNNIYSYLHDRNFNESMNVSEWTTSVESLIKFRRTLLDKTELNLYMIITSDIPIG